MQRLGFVLFLASMMSGVAAIAQLLSARFGYQGSHFPFPEDLATAFVNQLVLWGVTITLFVAARIAHRRGQRPR